MAAQIIPARFWQAVRFFLAPLLVIVMLTLGCGRAPLRLGFHEPASAPRRLQSVAEFNIGVGYNTQTSQFFMFSDYEAARQSPEASSSFLVAMSGYEVSGATESVFGRIDVQARNPQGSEWPVTAGVDFHSNYDWQTELAGMNREVTSEQFSMPRRSPFRRPRRLTTRSPRRPPTGRRRPAQPGETYA